MRRSITWRLAPAAAVIGWFLVMTGTGWAQQGGVFGASSPLSGASGFGTGTTGTASTGNAVNSTAFAKAGSGGAGAAQTQGLGNSNLSALNGQGNAATGQRNGLLGASNSRSGLLGATNQAGQQGALGQNGQRGQNQGNNRGANRGNANGQFQQQNFGNQGNTQGQGGANNQRQIRPQLKVAFEFKRRSTEVTERVLTKRFDNLNLRFQRLSQRASFQGVQIDAENGIVTLRGEVDTDETRKLAINLVALEPGVKSVESELTVTNPAPAETEE
ncbi:MAG: BON domain-containing protein [Planctomycetaceae bacterium]|nr:BON domain-containing protein [Planctomycetaceae bacterium]